MSPRSTPQQRKGFTVARLDRYDSRKGDWREIVVEVHKTGPADTAAARLDIADWLSGLPKRLPRVAETLAKGETTKARVFAEPWQDLPAAARI